MTIPLCLFALNLLSFQPPAAPSPAPSSHDASPVVSASPSAAPITEYRLSPDKQAQADSLYITRTTLFTVSIIAGILLPLVLILLRIGPRYRTLAERISTRRVLQALIYVPLLFVTMSVLSLPIDIYQQHVMRAYGMSVQTWTSWAADWGKGQVLTSVIAVHCCSGCTRSSGGVRGAGGSISGFHAARHRLPGLRYAHLDRSDVQHVRTARAETATAHRADRARAGTRGLTVPRERMFEMKASEKVTVYNAYVTGIGATKRIVVWDNTARDMTIPETLFVFGHEMGHYVLGHVYQLMGLMAAALFIALWTSSIVVQGMLARWGTVWQVRGLADWASLPVLILLLDRDAGADASVQRLQPAPRAPGRYLWSRGHARSHGRVEPSRRMGVPETR